MINYAFLTELPFEALSLEFVNEGMIITRLPAYSDTGYSDTVRR